MDYSGIRRLSLRVFLGFLGLTALIAVVSVLSGEMGEIQLKTIATSFAISAASICSMSCVAFIEKTKRIELGLIGIFLCVVAAILLIVGMWPEIDSEGYWKAAASLAVAAVAFAHACLLSLSELDGRHRWIQWASTVSIGVLVLQIVVAIWGEIDNHGYYYRFLAAVAILVGLETLCVPIVLKLQKGMGSKSQKLTLVRVEGDLYSDASGKTYQLKEITADQES